MTQAPLTRRQRQILDFIAEYGQAHGISPTLEEIAQDFGVNKVTIFGHVSELERKGFLSRAAHGVSRGLRLTRQAEDATAPRSNADADTVRPALPVSILGRIAAGGPIEAIEEPEELDLADLLPSDRDVYALRVRGDSMIEDGIHDGDLVLVERRPTARNGETVVAVLPDEESTLKRFYKEASGYRLQPANAAMAPIFVDDLEIRGVVIGVIRRF